MPTDEVPRQPSDKATAKDEPRKPPRQGHAAEARSRRSRRRRKRPHGRAPPRPAPSAAASPRPAKPSRSDVDLSDIEDDLAGEPVVAETTEKVKPLRMKISKAKERALMKEFGLDETVLTEEEMPSAASA